MPVLFKDLDQDIQEIIQPHLRPYFDKVTFENRTWWVMEYEMNDYEGFSSFDTLRYMDEKEFEYNKLDLFYHGDNLYEITKYGSIKLISKRKYSQPKKWKKDEIINLRNTNDFEEMRITAEIRNILQSEQLIGLDEMDFTSYNREIALIVNSIDHVDLSLASEYQNDVEHIVLHFSGPNDFKLKKIDEIFDQINQYFSPTLSTTIGTSINPDLSEELVSIFLFINKQEVSQNVY